MFFQSVHNCFSFQLLEACVKNCGQRFHQELGKFRFLNELIRMISPKVGRVACRIESFVNWQKVASFKEHDIKESYLCSWSRNIL